MSRAISPSDRPERENTFLGEAEAFCSLAGGA